MTDQPAGHRPLRTPPIVPARPPAPPLRDAVDQAALRDRIADVVRAFPFDDFGMDDVSYALEADPDTQEWVPKLADAVLAGLPATTDRAAPPSSFVLWLDASDGSVPTHDGFAWPDGTATVHHRHFGHTTTHADPEAARQSAHGEQGRIVWPETAPAERVAVLREAADAIDAETRQAKADEILEPDKFRPCRDASAQLRRMADETQQPEAAEGPTIPRATALREAVTAMEELMADGEHEPGALVERVREMADEAAAAQQPKEA